MRRASSRNGGYTRRDFVAGVTGATALLATQPAPRANAMTNRRTKSGTAFDVDRFVEDCVAAVKESDGQKAVYEVLARAMKHPEAVAAVLGEPTEAAIRPLHRSKALTILAATWTPQMNLMPHNHRMWANIGIYTGREDNLLWTKTPRGIDAVSAKALFRGDVAALPADTIHSVTNPLQRYTGGIHIYGGDFFETARSMWNPETLVEEPSNGDVIQGIFKRENERMKKCGGL